MATIAEQLLGITAESIQKNSPDITGGFVKGVELAQHAEQIANQRKQLEQKKADHNLQKYAKIADMIKIADGTKDAALQKSLFENAIPNAAKALGADDVYTEDTLNLLKQSPEARQKVLGYQLEAEKRISEGEDAQKVVAEVRAMMPDALSIASLDTDRLYKAQEIRAAEEQRNARNERMAQAQMGRQVQAQEATAQVKSAAQVGELYAKFTANRGKAGLDNTLNKLIEARDKLLSGEVKTGTVGKAAVADWPRVQALWDPKLKALVDDVRGSINMKAQLADPNPTAQQINMTLSRAIDPALPNAENVKKLNAMIQETINDAQSAQEQFIKQRLMSPKDKWTPPSERKSSGGGAGFAPTQAQKDQFSQFPPDKQNYYIKELAKKFNLSEDKIRKALGGGK